MFQQLKMNKVSRLYGPIFTAGFSHAVQLRCKGDVKRERTCKKKKKEKKNQQVKVHNRSNFNIRDFAIKSARIQGKST